MRLAGILSACLLALSLRAAEGAFVGEPESLPAATLRSGDPRDAFLDDGASVGLIPLGSPLAARNLRQYLEGFFRDQEGGVPKAALRTLDHLAEYKAAGASHLVILYHEAADETEHVRIILVGPMGADAMGRMETAGLGRRGSAGSFELAGFRDGAESAPGANPYELPIARLSQMAAQMASDADCSVDIVPLAAKAAAASYGEALREAFAEEGQHPDRAEVPTRAAQLVEMFPALKGLGATHVVVISRQNAKGSDLVLVLAQGVFSPEAQARLRTLFNPRSCSESAVLLQRWVDGEEKGAASATPAETRKRLFRK